VIAAKNVIKGEICRLFLTSHKKVKGSGQNGSKHYPNVICLKLLKNKMFIHYCALYSGDINMYLVFLCLLLDQFPFYINYSLCLFMVIFQ
jgi:hypothetical protein